MGRRERGGEGLIVQIEAADRRLLAGIAESLEEAARRSGDWLVCGAGCTECCMGPFGITPLDAWRLRRGLGELAERDPERAARVRRRAEDYVTAIAPEYPGDERSGELWDEDALPESMDETACPALDPETGWCDLYEARPVTCRTFGPVTRVGEGTFGACELCYTGATEEEMARCAVEVDAEGLEEGLIEALESGGVKGMTLVAFALRGTSGQAAVSKRAEEQNRGN